jgi:hypothetical protein
VCASPAVFAPASAPSNAVSAAVVTAPVVVAAVAVAIDVDERDSSPVTRLSPALALPPDLLPDNGRWVSVMWNTTICPSAVAVAARISSNPYAAKVTDKNKDKNKRKVNCKQEGNKDD